MTVSSPAASTWSDIHDPNSAAYKKARRKHWKSTKNRPENLDAQWTPFRAAEKHYKARFPPPDLSSVLDLASADPSRTAEVARGGWCGSADAVECIEIALQDEEGEHKGYIFPGTPGLVFLPSFVPPKEQRKLIRWALSTQARHPNETNLDTHYILPVNGLWNEYVRVQRGEREDADISPRASLGSEADPTQSEASGPRKLIANDAASPDNYLNLASTPKLPAPPSQSLRPISITNLLPKLRWANIGWYYHWGTKQYDFSRGPGEISPLVRGVCGRAVRSISWEKVFGDCRAESDSSSDWGDEGPDWMHWRETYEPDAGIVNFYQTKDTLMAHVDRSELCATSPLVSISLGCAAIFLIGGLTRDAPPTAILLRSGDAVVMAGPACRRAYHGVPRILEGTLPPHLEGADDECESAGDWGVYEAYLRTTRINVNVRQVFPRGFAPPQVDAEAS